ncbi:hypothetical protein [Virgibacillus ihumii]|nr:hypothetical protein [Virgibacillus ihumii]
MYIVPAQLIFEMPRAEHQLHGENINRTGGTSTARGKHQPHERNIDRTR